MLWSSLPRACAVADAAGGGQGLLGKGLDPPYLANERFNAMLINRKDIKVHQSPVDLMMREIGDRYSLIVFPEGDEARGGDRRIQERAVLSVPRSVRTWNWCRCISTT